MWNHAKIHIYKFLYNNNSNLDHNLCAISRAVRTEAIKIYLYEHMYVCVYRPLCLGKHNLYICKSALVNGLIFLFVSCHKKLKKSDFRQSDLAVGVFGLATSSCWNSVYFRYIFVCTSSSALLFVLFIFLFGIFMRCYSIYAKGIRGLLMNSNRPTYRTKGAAATLQVHSVVIQDTCVCVYNY